MSSEADQAAADKRVADEAAAAAASAAAASANWPTGGYYMHIPLLLISMCIVLAISVDVSTICLVLQSYMIKYQYVHVMLMFYSWINIIKKLPRFLTGTTSDRSPSNSLNSTSPSLASATPPTSRGMDWEIIIPRNTISICPTMTPIEEPRKPEKTLNINTHRREPDLPSPSRCQNGNRRGSGVGITGELPLVENRPNIQDEFEL
jgi:hypothetical protein